MKNLTKNSIRFQKPAVWMLLVANVVLAGGYVYSVQRTVFNVVSSTKAEKALSQSSATMSDLESRYMAIRNKITLDFAYAQGFEDASKHQIFIAKKSAGKTLSFNAL